ncbi:MAG: hypothetical protein AB7E47_14020 [Desulfovibrionaceae bacterium]
MTDHLPSRSGEGRRCLYIPGRNAANVATTGALLRDMGWDVRGPDVTAPFVALPFAAQLEVVAGHCAALGPGAPVVAKSYGAYVLLHVLLAHGGPDPIANPVLLFCPVMGAGIARVGRGMVGSLPPRARVLLQAARAGRYPCFARLEIHIGDQDVCAEQARTFAAHVAGAARHLAPGVAHGLGAAYEREALRRFLP